MSKFVFLKSLRELLTPLKRLIDRKAENVNWNENDPSSNSYIANRTHYKEEKEVFYLNNVKLTFANQWDNVYGSFEVPMLSADIGDIFTIIWDGTEYKCKVISFQGALAIGNTSIITGEGTGTGEPFIWGFVPNEFNQILTLDTAESHTVSCSSVSTIVHKIPTEYLPEISNVGKKDVVEGAEIFNDYRYNVAIGEYSHAEGNNTKAHGKYSHAEGYNTEAREFCSHAEGSYTVAGFGSHAEGTGSCAFGNISHAEGITTDAAGWASHTEGEGTQASSKHQHAQGRYNIADNADKYAHIVGNGSSSARSNAHTIDWNGIGWFAGGLKVGGTGQDDAVAKDVVLSPTTASVGQTLVVKSVDESGKPTEWGTIDPNTLTDTETGKKYQLNVVNGKLTMMEVE